MKAVIYARYFSDNQREESIEGQLRECKDFAEKNGMTILATYIDRALSAKTDNRPEFQRMIKDSSKDLFEKVQSRMTTNQKAPAKAKAPVEYLLTTKLFCGMCGALMLGESGHGYKGVVYNYYKCATAKKHRNCKKKTIKKNIIEKAVVQRVKEIIFDDYLIDKIADAIIELLNKENTIIPVLQKQLKEVEVSIENMLNTIQQGILTKSTKQRLDELESQKEELELSIAQEQIKRPRLTKEDIIVWIKKFRHGDIDDVKYQKCIIDSFVNSVYLYDDKIVLNCNYREGSTTITFDEIENSDLEGNASPKKPRKHSDYGALILVW